MRTLASVVAALLTFGLPAALNAQESPIQACVGRTGKLRVVGAPTSCTKKETPLSWAVAGPPGPEGPPGPGSESAPCVTTAKLTLGDVTGANADGSIDVVQYSFSLTYEPPFGGGGGQGVVELGDVFVTKRLDAASPAIFQRAIAGTVSSETRLAVLGADGVTPVLYYTLDTAVITSVQQSSSTCGGAPAETIALRFSNLKVATTPPP